MLRCRQSTWFVICLAAALCGCGTDAVEISRNAIALAPHDAPMPRDDDESHAPQAMQSIEKQIAAGELRPDDWFEDVTTRAGIRFTYRNGREAGRSGGKSFFAKPLPLFGSFLQSPPGRG